MIDLRFRIIRDKRDFDEATGCGSVKVEDKVLQWRRQYTEKSKEFPGAGAVFYSDWEDVRTEEE